MALSIGAFDNSYARLPERFHAAQLPARVAAPELVMVNRALAAELGLRLDGLDDATLAALFSGQQLPDGAAPLAMAYAGHQFGHFSPQLGDGRALLLGEVIDRQGQRRDIHFKGSGRTPFSRRGDGRAALGPVLREYLLGESMHALGIPTTRALAAVRTGEPVLREEGPLPGAVLTRVAASHLRVGTFEYFAAREDVEGLKLLTGYAVERHYPQAAEAEFPALALLEAVIERQAALIARWMLVGFVHGVMNTDNMAISGETIDYGPCAFLESYHPDAVFSAIDQAGRYAFGQQPAIGHWNLMQLARALLPLLGEHSESALGRAQAALDRFPTRFAAQWLDGMRNKLGLEGAEDEDASLIDDWLALLQDQQADFTLSFRLLCDCAENAAHDLALGALWRHPDAGLSWLARWRARLARQTAARPGPRAQGMRQHNPAIIARNHQVEQALQSAVLAHDDAPFLRLLEALLHPWAPRPQDLPYQAAALPDQRVTRTFCGT